MTTTITLINREDRGPAKLHNLLPLPDPGLPLPAVLAAKAWRPMKDEEAQVFNQGEWHSLAPRGTSNARVPMARRRTAP
jgi:hypothetical protein